MINVESLEKYKLSGSIVHIHRHIGFTPILCIPLAIGAEIVLIQYINDFRLEGYEIIRIKDISKVVREDTEIFIEDIIKKREYMSKSKCPISKCKNARYYD
jgi:hypothetical protein